MFPRVKIEFDQLTFNVYIRIIYYKVEKKKKNVRIEIIKINNMWIFENKIIHRILTSGDSTHFVPLVLGRDIDT